MTISKFYLSQLLIIRLKGISLIYILFYWHHFVYLASFWIPFNTKLKHFAVICPTKFLGTILSANYLGSNFIKTIFNNISVYIRWASCYFFKSLFCKPVITSCIIIMVKYTAEYHVAYYKDVPFIIKTVLFLFLNLFFAYYLPIT